MKVLEEIDRGGFGVVEKVELGDGSIVAKKTFFPKPGFPDEVQEKLRRRFEREVRYMHSISSEAICPVLDFDLDAEKPWFTMPFAERTLHDEISAAKSAGNVPTDALADLLNSLEEIHRLGFVHRDLKPLNVLLIDGTWRLADFGLILPPSGSTTMLTTASAWGTEAYAAPEQALEFHSVTDAADIYAFGCILHDVFGITQRIPFAEQSAPGLIGAVIERCTDVNPQKRFNSISALREALTSVLADSTDDGAESISEKAEDWVSAITDGSIGDSESFNQLYRYVSQEADRDERRAIFYAVSDDAISVLHAIDPSVWKQFFADYCDWASSSSFDFAYCDSLAQRLGSVCELADTEIKAAAIVAAARMAESHNRWFAMGKVVGMAGSDLDDDVADRLAIDIRALGLKRVFHACADRIHKYDDVYHPSVRKALGVES